MEDPAWYPNSAIQPHLSGAFMETDNYFPESEISPQAMEAWLHATSSLVSTPQVRNPRKRALTEHPALSTYHDSFGPIANQREFLESSVGTTGLSIPGNSGTCLKSYWALDQGPFNLQYSKGDPANYQNAFQQYQSAMIPSPCQSNKYHISDSPIAAGSEGRFPGVLLQALNI